MILKYLFSTLIEILLELLHIRGEKSVIQGGSAGGSVVAQPVALLENEGNLTGGSVVAQLKNLGHQMEQPRGAQRKLSLRIRGIC